MRKPEDPAAGFLQRIFENRLGPGICAREVDCLTQTQNAADSASAGGRKLKSGPQKVQRMKKVSILRRSPQLCFGR